MLSYPRNPFKEIYNFHNNPNRVSYNFSGLHVEFLLHSVKKIGVRISYKRESPIVCYTMEDEINIEGINVLATIRKLRVTLSDLTCFIGS